MPNVQAKNRVDTPLTGTAAQRSGRAKGLDPADWKPLPTIKPKGSDIGDRKLYVNQFSLLVAQRRLKKARLWPLDAAALPV